MPRDASVHIDVPHGFAFPRCPRWLLIFLPSAFSEVKAHDDLSLWPNVEDPAKEHTMSARTLQILETYARLYKETGEEQPFLKQAR